MKRRISIGWFAAGVLATVSLILSSYSSAPEISTSEQIDFSQQSTLSWEDYKARTGVVSIYKALTYTGISYKLDQNEKNQVTIDVTAYFDKDRSWVNMDSKTDILLNHEQRHFDITGIYAARMEKELEPYEGMDISKFMDNKKSGEVKEVFNRLYDEMEEKQRSYDESTQHSVNAMSQAKWDTWIDSEMKALNLERKKGESPVTQTEDATHSESSKSSPSKTGYRGR